jgi:hypothetical protein
MRSRDIYAMFRPHNTPIRSLDIRRGEKWSTGRVALHMALATAPDAILARPKRRFRLWHFLAVAYLVPACAAMAIVGAWGILHWGLR